MTHDPAVLKIGQRILDELVSSELNWTTALEMLGEVTASYLQRTQPELRLDHALGATLLGHVAVYMPASKYNGLDFSEEYLELGTWSDQLAVMCDAETFPELSDGTLIGEYPFEYETSYPNIADQASNLAGNHGTGMSIEAVAICILDKLSKHNKPIEPSAEMTAWAQAIMDRRVR